MLTIRHATFDDLDAITDIYNECVENSTATFDTEPRTREAQERWFATHGPEYPILVVEWEGAVVGWASLTAWSERAAYRRTAETSMYIAPEKRGQGIGRQLKTAIIAEARRLKFHTLIAGVAEGGEASIHLNKSFGFMHVATFKEVGYKFGKLLDVYYFQLML